MSKWRIEFEARPLGRCFAAMDDEECSITWCLAKGHNPDINVCVCNGLGNTGCPAQLIDPNITTS